MSLENSTSKVIYQGNGSTAVFPFAFKVWEPSQVRVMLSGEDGVEHDMTGSVAIELTATGGTVTFGMAPAEGTTLAILRSMPFVQEDRYITGTRFDPHEIEEALDIAAAERQELREELQRSVKLPVTDKRTPEQYAQELFDAHEEVMGMPARLEAQLVSIGDRYVLMLEEKVLALLGAANAFNGAAVVEIREDMPEGSVIELPELMQYVVGSNMLMLFYNGVVGYDGQQYREVGALGSTSRTVTMLHELRAGDMLQFRVIALHDYDVTAKGTTTPRNLSDRFADVVNVKDFGAVGDGVTDDTAAIRAAIVQAGIAGKHCVIPSGTYKITAISFPRGDYNISGENVTIYSKKDTPGDNDYALRFEGEVVEYRIPHPFSLPLGVMDIPRNGLNVAAGDLLEIYGTQLTPADHRSYWCRGCVAKVASVDDETIHLADTLPLAFDEGVINLEVTESISKTQCKFGNVDSLREDMMYAVECISGENNGDSFNIIEWDNTSKIATFGDRSLTGNGKSSWSYVPAVGDVYALKKAHTISVVKPTTVNLHGSIHLTRELTTNAVAGEEGFTGLRIQNADMPVVDGWRISNFSHAAFSVLRSYKPEICNTVAENANRLFDDIDGTGYGYSFGGCYKTYLHDFVASGCRSGLSNGHAGLCDILSLYSAGRISAGRTKTYTGEDMHPAGDKTQQSYGFGGHGNSYMSTYLNIDVIDCRRGTSLRDWDSAVIDCRFSGDVRTAIYCQTCSGITVEDCTMLPTCSLSEATHFAVIRANGYDKNRPITIRSSKASRLIDSFIFMSDATASQEISNIHAIGNTVSFYNDTSSSYGVGVRANVGNIKMSKCTFYGNELTYSPARPNRVGFLSTLVGIQENSYVKVGENRWFVVIASGSEVAVDTANTFTQTRVVSISTHDGSVASGLFLYSTAEADKSPLKGSNVTNVNVVGSSMTEVENSLNVYMNYGKLVLKNTRDKNLRLLVTVDGIN